MGGARKGAPLLLALLALGLAAFAPGAQAAKGVYNTFGVTGNKGLGGEVQIGNGGAFESVAVNNAGAGGVSPGDFYVVNSQGPRIERYGAEGNFIAAWGKDVVKAGAPGDTGTDYEVCTVAADCKAGVAGSLGGELSNPASIAVNQATGDVYVFDRSNRRIQQFSPTGTFIRAWGKDVVQTGQPGDNPAKSAVQQLSVGATGGKYTLEFEGQKTSELSFGANAGEIQAALTGLSTIGAGNVEVSGVSSPFSIAFKDAHANNPEPGILAASSPGEPLSGGGVSVATTVAGSTGFEICGAAASCQAGVTKVAETTTGGAFIFSSIGPLTIAPTGAPNAGNVLVRDGGNNRIQEFTSSGAFLRTFGWDVVGAGTGNTGTGFEVCTASAFDSCKAGTSGAGAGQFAGSLVTDHVGEDADGNIYMVESGANLRIQKFTLPGNVVTPQGNFDPEGKIAGTTTVDSPRGLAVDPSGRLYVVKGFPTGTGSPAATENEERILEIDPEANGGEGAVTGTLLAGSGVYRPQSGEGPRGLAINTATDRLVAVTYRGQQPVSGFIVDDVPPLTLTPEPSDVGAATAIFHATVAPSLIPLHTSIRFEYAKAGSGEWKSTPTLDLGNGSGAGSPESCPTGNPPLCKVSVEAQELEFGVTYEVKAIASTPFKGSFSELGLDPITTHAVPPAVITGRARWSSPPATGPSLTLAATINPGHDQTTYFFQYASDEEFAAHGFDSAKIIPLLPAQAGHGLSNIEVLQAVSGLDPAKTYRYRVIATNTTGTSTGTERSVDPPDPNALFYELLSTGESGGLGANRIEAVADSGERVALFGQAMGEPHALPNQASPFLSERGADGWSIAQLTPDPEHTRVGTFFGGTGYVFPTDLSGALWGGQSIDQYVRREIDWMFTNPTDGTFTQTLPTLVPIAKGVIGGLAEGDYSLLIEGASADLSTFLFQQPPATAYLPGQPLTTGTAGDIYRVSGTDGPSPTMTLLNRDPAGNLISNACGVWVGSGSAPGSRGGMSLRPVSTDGSVAYFSARPSGSTACTTSTNRVRIFKRIGDTSTVAVSASQCTRTTPTACSSANGDDFFEGASADGNRVFFNSTRQLTDTDEDSTSDLYLYDSSPPAGQPTLVQASAGEVTAGHAKAGVGAEFQGMVDISVDGSRAYFVAKGQLTSAATKGAFNLYVYERDDAHPTGRIAFVAKLDGGDNDPFGQALWQGGIAKAAFALPFQGPGGAGAGDGHFLLFGSLAKLAPEDTDAAADLYRYDDTSSQLICLTCVGNGNSDVEVRKHGQFQRPDAIQRNRIASEDLSTVVFATKESLVPEDVNSVSDAYEWRDGQIHLVSPGDSGSGGLNEAPTVSPDGKSVFFITEDRILPGDRTTALDVYGARLGGGFPEAPEEQTCASPDECRTKPTGVPAASSAATSSFAGTGNPASPKPGCAKGKVKRQGKCVKAKKQKRKQHKHKRQARKHRANDNRGGRR